jgi:organophosphate reductase
MEEIKMEYITLNNGVKMPKVGFGVYQVTDQNECRQAVLDAIDVGYRLIDTAQAYGNEEAVGEAIKMSGVDRKDLFITTKVWISNYGYEKAKMSVEESLKKMQLDYLDLVLLHQPFNDYYGAYQALVDLYKEGKIKAIGVSNFYPDRLVDMAIFSEVTPAINQVEVNVFHQQKEAQVYNEKYGVQLEAWAPFAEGRNNMFSNLELKAIGEKYGKTVAQVILRWLVQRNIVPLSKSVKKSRMEENINIFDFELSKEDMDKISEMDKKESSFFSHYDPSIVEMIAGLHQ